MPTPGSERHAIPRTAPPPIAQDYSPEGMFYEQYGDFHAKKDRFRPAFALSFRGLPQSSIDGVPGSFDQADLGLGGRARTVLGPDSLMILGADYRGRRFESSSTFPAPTETVHRAQLFLGLGHHVSDQTYIEGVFKPGVWSDFDGTLQGDDWQWNLETTATFEYSEQVFLKGGIWVDRTFVDLPVYPVAGLAWLFHDSWRADILLPRYAEVSWEASAASTLTLGLDLQGEEYRVRSSIGTGQTGYDIAAQELTLYVGGTHRMNDNLSLFGRFGAALAGHYEQRPPGIPKVSGQLDPTLMFELGVGWDF